ncbi:acyl-CoA dehydrogenase family protein [Glaciibacter psychrotolerans]|uniref:Alkylation response protein AidB-like acyl-CoA dehydrogenase n=1 Tax=Glaciibacter psychrotolerans TaxID=670054 RepID=A0A7Z0EGG7_9MICO|nr:acyl-CoA dehydrogenase family protein [Leifsonia psychrotolerans]NYJ20462.1 alkylation response protein AidB-like acyl-CoA dehydrogenase [Leifsonia psychrotolerans]
MRFMQTDEQLAFAEAIDDIALGMGGTSLARAWGAGDSAPGLALWAQFTELGLGGLRISEDEGGMGGSAGDLIAVFERLGYHSVPGPYVETIALLPKLVTAEERTAIMGGAVATAAVPGIAPYALDADVAALRFVVDATQIRAARPLDALDSMSPQRHLFRLAPEGDGRSCDAAIVDAALDEATLAGSAQLLGAGDRLLREAVDYAKIREQFGRPIGEYQGLKHQLADVAVALAFARPLLWQAALAVDTDAPTRSRDISAAKVTTADAAALAARVSLQVHGAIGYTAEHDLSLWLTQVPALSAVWGTPAAHRARIAREILAS